MSTERALSRVGLDGIVPKRASRSFCPSEAKQKACPQPNTLRAQHAGMVGPPIREGVVIYVNDKRTGSLWHLPCELDVGALLHPGPNQTEVHVIAINELAGHSLPNYRLLWARYSAALSRRI